MACNSSPLFCLNAILSNSGVQGSLVGGLLGSLLSGTNKSPINQGVNMNESGWINPETTNFGIGSPRVVSYSCYGTSPNQTNAYTEVNKGLGVMPGTYPNLASLNTSALPNIANTPCKPQYNLTNVGSMNTMANPTFGTQCSSIGPGTGALLGGLAGALYGKSTGNSLFNTGSLFGSGTPVINPNNNPQQNSAPDYGNTPICQPAEYKVNESLGRNVGGMNGQNTVIQTNAAGQYVDTQTGEQVTPIGNNEYVTSNGNIVNDSGVQQMPNYGSYIAGNNSGCGCGCGGYCGGYKRGGLIYAKNGGHMGSALMARKGGLAHLAIGGQPDNDGDEANETNESWQNNNSSAQFPWQHQNANVPNPSNNFTYGQPVNPMHILHGHGNQFHNNGVWTAPTQSANPNLNQTNNMAESVQNRMGLNHLAVGGQPTAWLHQNQGNGVNASSGAMGLSGLPYQNNFGGLQGEPAGPAGGPNIYHPLQGRFEGFGHHMPSDNTGMMNNQTEGMSATCHAPIPYTGSFTPAVNSSFEPQAAYADGGHTHHTHGLHPENIVDHVPIMNGRHDYRGGAEVRGAGTGQSDDIPAMLADGEYVIDAETVSHLGDGSNKAGAKVLDGMRKAIREHKRSAPLNSIPPKAKTPIAYIKQGEKMKGKK